MRIVTASSASRWQLEVAIERHRLAAEGQGDQQAMCTIDTVLREEYLNLALRHAAEPSSNPLAARVTRIAWHTAAAGYGSST
jgi:hypothetical protein